MIAVSSYKPNCVLQQSAKRTWNTFFDYVVYLGPQEYELTGPRTAFIPSEPFPRIKTAVEFCAGQPGWSTIINADIHLAGNFPGICNYLLSSEMQAAVSGRYQFDHPANGKPLDGKIEDSGLDIFAATQEVWQAAEKVIPEMFRFGHVFWDTWMVGFFVSFCGNHVLDFTPWKAVFHPRHTGGNRPYTIDSSYRDKYILKARWPLTQYAL